MVFPAPQGLSPAMYSMLRKYAGPSDPKDQKDEERKRKERRKENITIAAFWIGACVGICAFALWRYSDMEAVTTSDKVIACVMFAIMCTIGGFLTRFIGDIVELFEH